MKQVKKITNLCDVCDVATGSLAFYCNSKLSESFDIAMRVCHNLINFIKMSSRAT